MIADLAIVDLAVGNAGCFDDLAIVDLAVKVAGAASRATDSAAHCQPRLANNIGCHTAWTSLWQGKQTAKTLSRRATLLVFRASPR